MLQNHVWVDVTRHNSNLPPLAVKKPECLGLLNLLDRNKDSGVQHYCILKDGCLYFYASIRSTYAVGGIYLHGYTVREQPLGFKRSAIELKPPSEEFKVFYLCAENANENKRYPKKNYIKTLSSYLHYTYVTLCKCGHFMIWSLYMLYASGKCKILTTGV
ncbi:uncharacterized protein pdzph1 isoform X1 [Ictalurus furcatus]|uniref:uncharacterized protein pdzph1 isoform X1 n=1 Tax=Ictalurus furcatus TaxID=66913 RepID=UPI00235011C7|nr:uncharacterized protein pdzph1 isoform X1 [Ictalurus furcatus]